MTIVVKIAKYEEVVPEIQGSNEEVKPRRSARIAKMEAKKKAMKTQSEPIVLSESTDSDIDTPKKKTKKKKKQTTIMIDNGVARVSRKSGICGFCDIFDLCFVGLLLICGLYVCICGYFNRKNKKIRF